MPLYVYRCISCKGKIEKIRNVSHIYSPIQCPLCGVTTPEPRPIIQTPYFMFADGLPSYEKENAVAVAEQRFDTQEIDDEVNDINASQFVPQQW